MRAIYVDANRRTIDEVECPGYMGMMQLLDADALEEIAVPGGLGALISPTDLLYLAEWPKTQDGFRLNGFLIDGAECVGSGIIIGADANGDFADVRTRLLDAAMAIDFIRFR
jgi:hypothetical protein